MTPREALAAKLLAVLSPTEARSCIELLTLAGVPHTRTAPQSGAVALGDLIRRGLARRTGEPTMHRYLAAPASEVGPEERVELPELDATLTFTTKVGRPFGAPSDRTTVAVTCALGPSWPEGTRVPGWSTSLFAHQVAQGGLDAAKHNGTQRMRAALSALRSNPTRDLSPPAPEVPVATPDPTKFLEFTASVKNGARRDTCLSWLKARGLSRLKAEELIEQLQEEGKITAQDFVVAGETITRYLPADPPRSPARERRPGGGAGAPRRGRRGADADRVRRGAAGVRRHADPERGHCSRRRKRSRRRWLRSRPPAPCRVAP